MIVRYILVPQGFLSKETIRAPKGGKQKGIFRESDSPWMAENCKVMIIWLIVAAR